MNYLSNVSIFFKFLFNFALNFSGHKYPPPPLLNLRAASEGKPPNSSPGWTEVPSIAPYRGGGPPLSASARIQNPHTDLNNSLGTMSVTPTSSSLSGGGAVSTQGTHFVFNEATPPPRPPRPAANQLSTFEET